MRPSPRSTCSNWQPAGRQLRGHRAVAVGDGAVRARGVHGAGRTKEIGIRKVAGAGMCQIVRLLFKEFHGRCWSRCCSRCCSPTSRRTSTRLFADRIGPPAGAGSGVAAVLFSWLIVGIQAWRVAREAADPRAALRVIGRTRAPVLREVGRAGARVAVKEHRFIIRARNAREPTLATSSVRSCT